MLEVFVKKQSYLSGNWDIAKFFNAHLKFGNIYLKVDPILITGKHFPEIPKIFQKY